MADNLTITQGSGTTIAADDIAGAKYQRVKIGLGTDGNAADMEGGAGAVSSGVLRVTLASDDSAIALLTTIDSDTGTISTNSGTIATNSGTIASDTTTIATDTTAMSALLTTIDADTGSMATLLGTIDTDTGAMATLLGTIDADTGTIATDTTAMSGLLTTIDADTGSIATDMSAALTALQLIDDAIYTDDADWTDSTSKHMLTGGLYQSTRQTVTDGDVAPFQVNSEGVLLVYDLNAGAASGGTASADDADFTAGTTSGTPAMGVYESSPTSVTDGDLGIAGITSTRELKTSDASAAALLTTIDADTGSMATLLGTIDADTSTINTRLNNALIGEYETVAASQTDQALGATGGTGDYLAAILIVPATTSPGAVSIKDGAGSAITIFTGGTDSVSNLVPFTIPLGITSAAGAWQVTTGTNVSCIGIGNFT